MSVATRRGIKFLHEVGTVGFMGSVVAQLVLAMHSTGLPPAEYASMREAILILSEVLLLPSLVLVLISGLWAMAASTAYHNASWAWAKLGTTILVLEGTLMAVQGPAQAASEIAAEIAAGDASRLERLEQVLRHERGGLSMILLLSAANIALAVWRPRFARRKSRQ